MKVAAGYVGTVAGLKWLIRCKKKGGTEMRVNVTITSLVDFVNAHRNTEDIFVYISLKDRSSFSINASKTTLLALADGIKDALARLEQQEKEEY